MFVSTGHIHGIWGVSEMGHDSKGVGRAGEKYRYVWQNYSKKYVIGRISQQEEFAVSLVKNLDKNFNKQWSHQKVF